nr:hypothetical protein GCM10020092_061120 [Actinoplanes digitatis]
MKVPDSFRDRASTRSSDQGALRCVPETRTIRSCSTTETAGSAARRRASPTDSDAVKPGTAPPNTRPMRLPTSDLAVTPTLCTVARSRRSSTMKRPGTAEAAPSPCTNPSAGRSAIRSTDGGAGAAAGTPPAEAVAARAATSVKPCLLMR